MEYTIGSKLLNLNNTKDNDILIISTEHDYKRVKVNGKDCVYRSEEHIKKHIFFENEIYNSFRIMLLNYQLDQDIIGQNFPIEYHILDHREKVIELLNHIVDNKLLNCDPRITNDKGCCSKLLYHIVYNIFILQNNSIVLSEEQQTIIQTIHDGLMPISYIDDIQIMLKELQ